MGFIKGPVCRGQIALDVIEDRFWVAFLAPSDEYDHAMATLLQQDRNLLRLPTGSSNTGVLIPMAAAMRGSRTNTALYERISTPSC